MIVKDVNVIVYVEGIRRWKEYFECLLSTESRGECSFANVNKRNMRFN